MKTPEIFKKDNRTSFLLNFMAVVLGIVLTFGGESVISHRQEASDLTNCLNLVASELRSNEEILHLGDSLMRSQAEAALFLIRYEDDYTKAPQDSLMMMANTPLFIAEMSIYTDAFELLKSSGCLMKIKDKELALEIFKTYGELQDSMRLIGMFYEQKTKYAEAAMTEDVKDILSKDNVTAIGLWSEITKTRDGQQFLREIIRFLYSYDTSGTQSLVSGTVARIEEYTR